MADIALVMCDDYYCKVNSNKHQIASTLYYLKGAFDRYGLQTDLYNPYFTGQDLESLARDIKYSGAKAIGISAASGQSMIASLKKMCEVLKELNLPIIVGGYCSIVSDLGEMIPEIDAVFLGEGEERGPMVFERYINGELPYDILGVKYRDGDKLVYTGKAPLIKDLDSITPDFGLVRTWIDEKKLAVLYTSRGCYNACSFCFIRYIHGRGIRTQSTEKMIQDIIALAELHDIKYISYHDDDFLFISGRLDGIAPTLRKYNITVSFGTRVSDILRPEIKEEILRNKDVITDISCGQKSFVLYTSSSL